MSESLNLGTAFGVIIFTSMISVISLSLQVFVLLKNRKKQKNELFDAVYVENFFRAVGQYLDGLRNLNPSESGYKAMAADIYRHVPSKHWMLIEKIDQAITKDDVNAAWENLKLLSQSLAEDGIAPISLEKSAKNIKE